MVTIIKKNEYQNLLTINWDLKKVPNMIYTEKNCSYVFDRKLLSRVMKYSFKEIFATPIQNR